jgi:hypothetical protein
MNNITSSAFERRVRESPDIAKSRRKANAGQQKFYL